MSQGSSSFAANNSANSSQFKSHSVCLPDLDPNFLGCASPQEIESMSMHQQMKLNQQLSQQLIYLTQQLSNELAHQQVPAGAAPAPQLNSNQSEHSNDSINSADGTYQKSTTNYSSGVFDISLIDGCALQKRSSQSFQMPRRTIPVFTEEERRMFKKSPVMGFMFNNSHSVKI